MDEFRVLIVGGGPAGLSFANMLAQFGIDFLLLERYPAVVTDIGANITLLPHSVRIFDAMGLLEHCEGQYVNLGNKVNSTYMIELAVNPIAIPVPISEACLVSLLSP